MVKTASVFSRLETMEYLSVKRHDSTDKLLKINNLSGRRWGFTDESLNRDFHALWFYALKVTSHVTEDRASE